MRKMNTGFKSIDIICITHCHGDHVFGLPDEPELYIENTKDVFLNTIIGYDGLTKT